MSEQNLTNFCMSNDVIKTLMKSMVHNEEATDATWILTSAFIIFTMQSGFGLLEAGSVSSKNECNIMVKNAVDVVFGSFCYWVVGFGLSYGNHEYSNQFVGVGSFFADEDSKYAGDLHSKYFFQLSFATTANTIVSGAMAERTKLKAYMIFSFFNVIVFSIPAHWYWDERGFLHQFGVVDVAGCGPVHVYGGITALVATLFLKPRTGMFEKDSLPPQMASPTNVLLGTFMLWWGWLGFNTGSTFGLSEGKWMLASRASVTTVNASVGGGTWSVFYCYFITMRFNKKLDVVNFTSCILGGLVSVTACCALCRPWEALLIGTIGGAIVSFGSSALQSYKIDDPVSAVPIHLFCGIWGLLCSGIFSEKDDHGHYKSSGIAKGGDVTVIAYQLLGIVCTITWATIFAIIQFYILSKTIGLRVSLKDESLGADFVEHGINLDETSWFTKSNTQGRGRTRSSTRARGRILDRSHSLKTPREIEILRKFSLLHKLSLEDVVVLPNRNTENGNIKTL